MSYFYDKTAIVTGAGSGIGRALSQELARRGARVVLADVNPERVETAAAAISAWGRPRYRVAPGRDRQPGGPGPGR